MYSFFETYSMISRSDHPSQSNTYKKNKQIIVSKFSFLSESAILLLKVKTNRHKLIFSTTFNDVMVVLLKLEQPI